MNYKYCCLLVATYKHFRQIYCLFLQHRRIRFSGRKMEQYTRKGKRGGRTVNKPTGYRPQSALLPTLPNLVLEKHGW
jgi:hypothetical protein